MKFFSLLSYHTKARNILIVFLDKKGQF